MTTRRIFNIRDDVPLAIGLGLVKGVKNFEVFGARSGLAADVETDISRLATTTVPTPANAGEQLEIVSTDPGDTQTIEVESLGPNGVLLEPFQVQLNGTTPVLFPQALVSRINEIENNDTTPFVGTVNIQAQGGGTIFGTMRPQDQQMNQAFFTIPAGRKWMVKRLIGTLQRSTGTENDVTLSILFKRFDGTAWRRPFSFGLQRSGDSTVDLDNRYPNVSDGPVDIKITAVSTVSGATVSAWINGLLL